MAQDQTHPATPSHPGPDRSRHRLGVLVPAVLSVVFVLLGVLDVVDALRKDDSFAGGLLSFGMALALASRPRSETRGGLVLWLVPVLCLVGIPIGGFLALGLLAF